MKGKKKRKPKAFTVILFIITGLYIAFIWLHSTQTAEESTVESVGVMTFLNDFFAKLGLSMELTDFIVRKSAHFCEFALLGCLSFWSARQLNGRFVKNLMPVGFVCLATAVTDELIQMYSPGRSSQVTDVILDFSGAAAGVLFFSAVLAVVFIIRRIIKGK